MRETMPEKYLGFMGGKKASKLEMFALKQLLEGDTKFTEIHSL